MKENYKLEKEYKIPFEIFKKGYTAFQKKFIYPKTYIYTAIFIIIAVVFIAAVIEDKSQYIAYMLIVISVAMAVRQWYNPRKLRSELFDTVKAMGEPVYKIGVAKEYVDISTVNSNSVESKESEEASSYDDEEQYELPEKTRIQIDNNYDFLEYDEFFLLFSGKELFYIVPKSSFDEEELKIIRNTAKSH